MIKNYFNIAIRTLIKNPLFSFIKISGLTVGVCGCIVIFLVARFELSFDKFQPDGDRIYRVYSEFTGTFKGFNSGVPTPLPLTIKQEFTGLDAVTHFHTYDGKVETNHTSTGIQKFDESDLMIAAPDYFSVFNHYEWLAGTVNNLNAPFTVAITESKARKYFGIENPEEAMGKPITYSDSLEVIVVGIVKDVNEITDFEFGDFISYSTIEKSWLKETISQEWGDTDSGSQCFIKLSKGTPLAHIKGQIPLLVKKRLESLKEPDGPSDTEFKLQPLSDLHYSLSLGTFDGGRPTANLNTLYALIITALLLLCIAAINFINLETAQTARRSKEVGLRKTMGGTQAGLVKHFLLESSILVAISLLFALPLAELSIAYFNEFLPKGVALNLMDSSTIIFLLITLIVVVLLSGLYPAFVLSSCQPAQALKTQLASGRNAGSAFLRKVLTVFQFSFSQALIIATLIVGWQINFMFNKGMGFEKDAIVTFKAPWWVEGNRSEVFQNELQQLAEVALVTRHNLTPASSNSHSSDLTLLEGETERPLNLQRRTGDTTYLSFYKIPLIAGRMVQASDSAREYLVNEAYCNKMGYAPHEMVGKTIKGEKKKNFVIVGVMRDFNFRSLHHAVEPLFFAYNKNEKGFSIRLNSTAEGGMASAIERIKAAWAKIYPEVDFTYTFLDDQIKKLYESEKRVSKLASTATGLTIFISCLGLFGLATFTTLQRTKEIGIRKVLGASVTGIVSLLSGEFLLLVVIAFSVACPIAWYGATQWLTTFAYRIDLGWEVFALAIFSSLLIAFVTVGFQAIRAAMANPVESLRSE
jgi:putative ABC transport system permease protein